MDRLRRALLKGSGASAILMPLLAAGLLKPGSLLAAPWNRPLFVQRNINEVLKAYGAGTAGDSREILINGPDIAENGSKVDIEVISNLPDTRSIAIFTDRNPMPLSAIMEFGSSVLPYARIQLKLAETTRIRVVAKTADGKNHIASREIKVTLGGCGG